MNKLYLLILLFGLSSCTQNEVLALTEVPEEKPEVVPEVPEQPEQVPEVDVRTLMVDSLATAETVALYERLLAHTQHGSGLLYGHESSNMQGWSFKKFNPHQMQSDVLTSIGDLPALFGYDFNRGYTSLLPIAHQAAAAGGIITISNHMKFPTTNSYHYSAIKKHIPHPVQAVLPGGQYHQELLAELDRIAHFAKNLTLDGVPVPILFRPWHEHTGGWYWWGTAACTEEEFTQLWQFTVSYLRDVKAVHNLLYVFSPSRPGQRQGYTYRNPGNPWFDIAGFDCYHTSEEDGARDFMINARATAAYAKENGKIAAIAEFGYKKGIDKCTNPNWYTECFLQPLAAEDLLSAFAYCMNWQNSEDGYATPRPSDLQYADFVRFHDNDEVHFLLECKEEK